MLDIKKSSLNGLKMMTIIAMLVLLISRIYYLFSHNVQSIYMTYAFLIPLSLGIIIYLILPLNKKAISRFSYNMFNAGILTITLASLIKGILDIASSSQSLLIIYIILGLILIIIGTVKYFWESR